MVYRILVLAMTSAAWLPPLNAAAQTPDTLARKLDEATRRLGEHSYALRYKFRKGETIGYEVEHLVSVKTTIDGTSQTQQSRSRSRKVWSVQDVAAQGQATFTHRIEYVNMWSECQGSEAVKYDSRTDKKPPADYRQVAEMVGKVLSTITVDQRGTILDRQDGAAQIDLGTGGILVPLPEKPVKLGDEWSTTADIPVRLDDGNFKAINTRQRYRLENVDAGVATISLQTQILTPSVSARARSQLIQKLSNGTIKFDLDAGRILAKNLEWDETVVGFNGPSSNLAYLGRISENLHQASKSNTASAQNQRSAQKMRTSRPRR
jgi:hypothetical protein